MGEVFACAIAKALAALCSNFLPHLTNIQWSLSVPPPTLAQLDSQKVRDVSNGECKEQALGTWEEPRRQRWKGKIN